MGLAAVRGYSQLVAVINRDDDLNHRLRVIKLVLTWSMLHGCITLDYLGSRSTDQVNIEVRIKRRNKKFLLV